MNISTRTRYGLRLMIQLAIYSQKGPLYLKDIAKNESISLKYLSQIILPLKAAGLISAPRGVHSGYVLGRKPEEISVKDIVEVLEGSISLLECLQNPGICARTSMCTARVVWDTLANKMKEVLSAFTLDRLAAMSKDKAGSIADIIGGTGR